MDKGKIKEKVDKLNVHFRGEQKKIKEALRNTCFQLKKSQEEFAREAIEEKLSREGYGSFWIAFAKDLIDRHGGADNVIKYLDENKMQFPNETLDGIREAVLKTAANKTNKQ